MFLPINVTHIGSGQVDEHQADRRAQEETQRDPVSTSGLRPGKHRLELPAASAPTRLACLQLVKSTNSYHHNQLQAFHMLTTWVALQPKEMIMEDARTVRKSLIKGSGSDSKVVVLHARFGSAWNQVTQTKCT